VPKSKVRKKSEAPARVVAAAPSSPIHRPSPSWYPIVMAAVFVLALAYLVAYYLAGDSIPVMQDIGGWNFAVGFGILIVGLFMAVRWR
jgi:membrane protease YdiL (CAAX protease family)